MSNGEKLRTLIDMAWEHGWRGVDNELEGQEPLFDAKLCDYLAKSPNHILFDPEFIKALCRAKHGTESVITEAFTRVDGTGIGRICRLAIYELELMELAVSADRLGYLWNEFAAQR